MTYTGKRRLSQSPQSDPHEWQEQSAFFQWVDSHIDRASREQIRVCVSDGKRVCEWELSLVHSTPNEGERHIAVAGKLKAMGLRAGYPDVSVDAARGQYHGLRIEFKRRSEKLKANEGVRTNQSSWHDRLIRAGYCVRVAYDWEQAKNILVAYLLGEIDQYGVCNGPEATVIEDLPARRQAPRTDIADHSPVRRCATRG